MIAEPDRHLERDVLSDLLEESLSSQRADQVESHLAACPTCRDLLADLAGTEPWWRETIDVLSESTQGAHARQPVRRTVRNADPSIDWIEPLLDPPLRRGELGRIDHYSIAAVIGQGGMGVVLKGLDEDLNRPVAIKILAPHLAGVGAARQRFLREAQAAAAVVHPSVTPIYGVATHRRLPYLVMPCISGGNLQQRIDREGALELSEVLRIGLQVAEGLAAAHRHGVIHRDIKPANILLEDGNGRVLISDFGLARALDDATLTISGMIAGTPQFMSPEQARGDAVDARSDLFSLGSLIYTLATGRPPYRAASPLGILHKITHTRPRPLHQINERMPAWLDALVSRLMQIDPQRRTPTADQAALDLQAALAHVRNPSANPLPRQVRTALPLTSRRTAWAVTGLAAVLLLITIGGRQLWWPDNAPTNTSANEPTSPLSPGFAGESDGVSDTTGPLSPGFAGERDGVRGLPSTNHDWLGRDVSDELSSINWQITVLEQSLKNNSPADSHVHLNSSE